MAPLISVIIPVYNGEKYIRRCLDSLLSQTFTDLELLCVNDGSRDNSGALLHEYERADSRVRVFDKENGGASSARNFGLENARGEYIGFADIDDEARPQMYEFLYRALTENGADFSMCDYDGIMSTEKLVYHARETDLDEIYPAIDPKFFGLIVWNKLIRRELLRNLAFPIGYVDSEDFFVASQLCARAKKIAFVDIPLYVYHTDNPSATRAGFNPLWMKSYELYTDMRKILQSENAKVSGYCVVYLCKTILSHRFIFKQSEYIGEIKKRSSKYFRINLPHLWLNTTVSFKTKAGLTAFFFVPALYAKYRKKLDLTL